MPIHVNRVYFLCSAAGALVLTLCGCASKDGNDSDPATVGPDGVPIGGGGTAPGTGGAVSTGGSTVSNGGAPVSNGGAPVSNGGVPGAGGAIANAGSGGESATGGAGGAPVVPACVPATSRCDCRVPADGVNALIDGFEDGDSFINEIDSRSGEWFQANGLASGMPLGIMAREATTPGAPGSAQALHVTGGATGAMNDWATFGVTVGQCYDASPYTGISFWIKGTAAAGNDTIRFSLSTPPTTAVSAGGECPDADVGCYDHFGAPIILTPEWQKIELTWAQLVQVGWGTAAPAGYAKEQSILAINFAPFLNTMGYDFWIDSVEFMTGTPGNCGDLISEAQFNAFFPIRNPFYTYASFVEAAAQWPSFCNEGDETARLRDVAALFGHFVQETGNQTGPTSGLVHIEEIDGPSKDYCDEARTDFPCAPGQAYHGRGAMQLTWNYNYGTAGKALGLNLLQQPSMVSASGTNAFNVALWFWMTRQPLKSPHSQIVTGEGFGATIRTVNGPLECDGLRPEAVANRVNSYVYFCEQLGIDPGPNQGC